MGSAGEGESQGETSATLQAQGGGSGTLGVQGGGGGVHLGLREQRSRRGEGRLPRTPPPPRRLPPLGRHTLVCSKSSEVQIPLQSLPRGAQTAGVSRTVSSRRTRGNAPTSVTAAWRGCGRRRVCRFLAGCLQSPLCSGRAQTPYLLCAGPPTPAPR